MPPKKLHRTAEQITAKNDEIEFKKQTAQEVYQESIHRQNEVFSFGGNEVTAAKPNEQPPEPQTTVTPTPNPTPPTPTALPVEANTYQCHNCKAVILRDNKRCSTCGSELNWSGIV